MGKTTFRSKLTHACAHTPQTHTHKHFHIHPHPYLQPTQSGSRAPAMSPSARARAHCCVRWGPPQRAQTGPLSLSMGPIGGGLRPWERVRGPTRDGSVRGDCNWMHGVMHSKGIWGANRSRTSPLPEGMCAAINLCRCKGGITSYGANSARWLYKRGVQISARTT